LSNSITNWNLNDRNPEKEIDDIPQLSSRAWSLLARNRAKPLLQFGFLNVTGAIEMIEAFEYHHDNIIRISGELGRGELVPETHVNHEALAYLNRLGQFYYFATSALVSEAISNINIVIPTISKFMVFRNKHTAHRSIDAPKKDDTEDLKIAHARAVSSIMGSLFSPKPDAAAVKFPEIGVSIEFNELKLHMQKELWSKSYRTFQTFDSAIGSHVNFTVEVEHPRIVAEAYGVIERVIMHE
jgi:hypothetical protein